MICTDDLKRKNKRLSKEVQSSGIWGSRAHNRIRQVITEGNGRERSPTRTPGVENETKTEQKNTKQVKNKCTSYRKESQTDEKGQMGVVSR